MITSNPEFINLAMDDPLTSPDTFANPPLTSHRLEEIKADTAALSAFLLKEHHPRIARMLTNMVNDLLCEVKRADGIMHSLLGVALADCVNDNNMLREALARHQTPGSAL